MIQIPVNQHRRRERSTRYSDEEVIYERENEALDTSNEDFNHLKKRVSKQL